MQASAPEVSPVPKLANGLTVSPPDGFETQLDKFRSGVKIHPSPLMKDKTIHKLTAFGLAGLFVSTGAGFAGEAASPGKSVAPLFDGLGHHHHPITTTSKQAQRYFDQGLTLCFAFNHTEAIRSFRGALKHDPDCAMAY